MEFTVPRPSFFVLGRTISAFHLCGVVGWLSSIALVALLVVHQGPPLWATGVLAIGSIATFLALVMAEKILFGEENIVYYHHEIAVVAVSALAIWLLGMPLLPFLDAVFMGLGLFLACGRIGCLMVGCCHGRPQSWGVSYRAEHAEVGFAPHLVGVPLVPIQLVEALFVAATVVVGVVMILSGAASGSALAFYSIAYGLARSVFELFRGDTARPYWRGGSEAQWTSLVIMLTVLALGGLGPVPFRGWLLVATLAMGTMLTLNAATDSVHRRFFRPRHVLELAELLDAAHARTQTTGELHIGQTSLGLRISASRIRDGGRWLDVFAISDGTDALDERTARKLTLLISRLRRGAGAENLMRGAHGVYHVILPAATSPHEVAHAV